ncbi:unnamed protein product [Closterium sp. Naga37s-1]|nr:unnamed protein product [Closterium sp. Naga37s-1]
MDEGGIVLAVLLAAVAVAAVTAPLLVLLPGVDELLRRLKDGSTDDMAVMLTALLATLPFVAVIDRALLVVTGGHAPLESQLSMTGAVNGDLEEELVAAKLELEGKYVVMKGQLTGQRDGLGKAGKEVMGVREDVKPHGADDEP